MHYRVTVTKNGQHYFSTDLESCPSLESALAMRRGFLNRFPSVENFNVHVFQVATTAMFVDPNNGVSPRGESQIPMLLRKQAD